MLETAKPIKKKKRKLTKEQRKRYNKSRDLAHKRNSTAINIRFANSQHQDVIDKLMSVPSKREYIVMLIRNDIASTKK